MEILFKIIYDALFYLTPLILLLYTIALINLPITNFLFISTKDRGFQIAKVFGLILISYIYFTIVSLDSLINLGIFKLNSFISISSSVAINVFLNFIILKKIYKVSFHKYYENLFLDKRKALLGLKKIFIDEKIFIPLIIFFYFLNAFEKSVTTYSEQLLHYMVIEKLRISEFLPINDPEFAGEEFNYYYFGLFICYTISVLLPFPIEYSYLLLLISIPSLVGVLFIQLVRDLNLKYFKDLKFNFSKKLSLFFSFIILFFFSTFTFSYHFINSLQTNNLNIDPALIWNNLTRPIENVITENISFSVTYNTLHSQFMSLLFCILLLRVLFIIHTKGIKFNVTDRFYVVYGFVLGLMIMTNTADYVTYFLLLCIFILINQFNYFISNKKILIKKILLFVLIPFSTASLWIVNIDTPGGIPDMVRDRSSITGFLSFWGSYIALISISLYVVYKKIKLSKLTLPFVLFFFSSLTLLLLEFFYLKDASWASQWHRANTYNKFSYQVLLFLSIFIGVIFVPFWYYSNKFLKILYTIVCIFYSVYIPHFFIDSILSNRFTGISIVHENSDFFQNNPYDKDFYNFIGNKIFQNKVFIEYNDTGYAEPHYSVLLRGYSTFLGYISHEIYWRGKSDLIYKRIDIVNEIFLGDNLEESKNLLSENKIDYIVVSNWAEESVKNGNIFNYNNVDYPVPHSIKIEKLLKLGEIVFENQNIKLIEVNK